MLWRYTAYYFMFILRFVPFELFRDPIYLQNFEFQATLRDKVPAYYRQMIELISLSSGIFLVLIRLSEPYVFVELIKAIECLSCKKSSHVVI